MNARSARPNLAAAFRSTRSLPGVAAADGATGERAARRSRRVAFLLALTVGLSAVDLFATLGYICTIGLFEMNPIVLLIARWTGSAAAIALFKVVTTLAGLAILFRVRHHVPAELAAWAITIVLGLVCVGWIAYSRDVDSVELFMPVGDDASWVALS